ncbi:hypothetical protein [Piscirickettsia salmonis]|uniref:hypothetical protein n=1 Tax=Piscirickettsia salmonis TaxID=1238 RepID=UPI0012B6EEF0|nr:hypothetical protein [Piscirickettsia salmonis]
MLGDFASLDVQNTYRGSDAYDNVIIGFIYFKTMIVSLLKIFNIAIGRPLCQKNLQKDQKSF